MFLFLSAEMMGMEPHMQGKCSTHRERFCRTSSSPFSWLHVT